MGVKEIFEKSYISASQKMDYFEHDCGMTSSEIFHVSKLCSPYSKYIKPNVEIVTQKLVSGKILITAVTSTVNKFRCFSVV
jgi:hypothetical protein